MLSNGAVLPRRRTGTPDPKRKAFGDHLRVLRAQANLTQEQVAERLGITPGAYQHYEGGRSEPRFLDAPKLAAALGVGEERLFAPFSDRVLPETDRSPIPEAFQRAMAGESVLTGDALAENLSHEMFLEFFQQYMALTAEQASALLRVALLFQDNGDH